MSVNKMNRQIHSLRAEAQKKFLGRNSIIGVGIGGDQERELIFLLQEDIPDTRARIFRWARQNKIKAQIQIIGRIKTA
jgi:hypothetical protein